MASEEGAKPMAGRKVLTRSERADLLNYHVRKLREQGAVVETVREPLTAAQDELTARYNEAKADLGKAYTRKVLQVYVADTKASVRDLKREEVQRAEDRADLGLPVFNQQPELFAGAETPQEARDEFEWEAEGYLRGRRGDIEEIRQGDPVRFTQAILKGFERGQKETQAQFEAGQKLKASLAEPASDEKDVNLNDEPEPTAPEVIDSKVRQLRAKGFDKAPAPAAVA